MKECQLCKNCFTDNINTCPNDGMPTFHSLSGEPVLEGKYHLECRIGQGGMGVVYKSRHAYLKTSHAIKIILPDLVGNDPELVTRFRQEALAAAAIRHQNVVGVSDYGVAQGTMPFLVMEYVEGESLHDLLARERILSPERALEIMAAIAAGVGAAHSQGIVHRDLKPLNVMIVKGKSNISEAVKILDFGLAKIKSGELLGSFIQAQTTGLMGSPYYMAPEQWADEEPDARSDVYSLGVMLYQMIASDVPFKGSSIPAIMKKHLSDLPPPLSSFGVKIAPQVELAIRHSLEKEPDKRTATVEQLVEELRMAIGITSQNLHISNYAMSGSLSISSLSILTSPPQSEVFVDNVPVGQSQSDGWLTLDGLQSGNHLLRISHTGFQDWENSITFDGKPKQVVAELKADYQSDTAAIPKPDSTMSSSGQMLTQNTPQNLPASQTSARHLQQNVSVQNKPKKSLFFSPLFLSIIGISGLLLLAIIGVGGAYMAGFIGRTGGNTNGNKNIVVLPNNSNTNNQTSSPEQSKADMVKIPGGKFKMGRNDGSDFEKPEHEVDVSDFWMDKTEVTTEEYYDFVKANDYKPTPAYWEDGKPLASEGKLPIRYVNMNDVKAFAEWRSKRDGVIYRLPTESEWEYAARNGAANNYYPWGDEFKIGCAVVDQPDTKPETVGSKDCGANKWGVLDLIGNVYEWTSTETNLYPGNPGKPNEKAKNTFVFRGGSAFNKSTGKNAITSTYRGFIEPNTRDAQLGFRLVRSNQ
ncbi:MAG: SUMF1/EgtB/PvdO family nonheme iron enzyme [Pyrinomonadaceae bacterium]